MLKTFRLFRFIVTKKQIAIMYAAKKSQPITCRQPFKRS